MKNKYPKTLPSEWFHNVSKVTGGEGGGNTHKLQNDYDMMMEITPKHVGAVLM